MYIESIELESMYRDCESKYYIESSYRDTVIESQLIEIREKYQRTRLENKAIETTKRVRVKIQIEVIQIMNRDYRVREYAQRLRE